MRKTKIIIYIGLALGLLTLIATLSGYRLSAKSVAQEINEQAHFNSSVLVYENNFDDTAILVYQHEDWLSCITVTRSFGFLWKAKGNDPQPVNTQTLASGIKQDMIISSLVVRSRWPEKLEGMDTIALYGGKPYALTTGQWWILTDLLSPESWKLTDPTLTIGQRTLLMVLTDFQGGTISIYNDLQQYHTGYYLVLVKDAKTDSPARKYFMKANLIDPLIANAEREVEIAMNIERFNQLTFTQGASETPQQEPWPVDLVTLTPAQSTLIKDLLRIETWQPVKQDFVTQYNNALTLIDDQNVTYQFNKELDAVQITVITKVDGRITQRRIWTAPVGIVKPIQDYLDAQVTIVPPSQDALDISYSSAQLGYSDWIMGPAYFDRFEDPSYRFSLTTAQNKMLKSWLQTESWNQLDPVLEIDQYPDLGGCTFALFGTKGERIFICAHTPVRALVIIEFKDHKEYYTMDPASMVSARTYLLTVFEPKAPVARVMGIHPISALLYDKNGVVGDSNRVLSLSESIEVKARLKLLLWKQAVNIYRDVVTDAFLVVETKEGLSLQITQYQGQLLILIRDWNDHQEGWGIRYAYLAPLNIKASLIDYVQSIQ